MLLFTIKQFHVKESIARELESTSLNSSLTHKNVSASGWQFTFVELFWSCC